MAMHRRNKDSGSSNSKYNARWFTLNVIRQRRRKGYKVRSAHPAAPTTRNLERQGKMRGLDGTMFGPLRSRGT